MPSTVDKLLRRLIFIQVLLLLIFTLNIRVLSKPSSTSTLASLPSLFDSLLEKDCSARCERLYNRSLKKIGFSIENVAQVLRSKANAQDASVICWKFLDYDDCERQCEKSNRSETSSFTQDRNFIVRKCSKLVARSPYLKHFKCLHRFHTFLEVRCSSFAKEAARYRYLSKLAKSTNDTVSIEVPLMPVLFHTKRSQMPKTRHMSRETLIQETCRYLHYHSTCLANAVFNHCPNANDLFNRFTLLDYFLSFVVPKNDQMFTDKLLNYCQMYDFQKIARDLFESTKTTVKRDTYDNVNGRTQLSIYMTRPYTLLPDATTRYKFDKAARQRNLFSSDEDLAETPPNFYYSSAKYTKAYREAMDKFNHYQVTMANRGGRYPPIDNVDLITHPVPLDFNFEAAEEEHYKRQTLSPIQLTTRPDSLLTETQLGSHRPKHQNQRNKDPKGQRKGPIDSNVLDFDEETDNIDYSPISLWPQRKEDSKDDADDYNNYHDGPLFRHEQPYVFQIRQYGVDEEKGHAQYDENNIFGHKPSEVTVDHIDGIEINTQLPYDYSTNNDEEADPNAITYPGRREHEQTTRPDKRISMLSNILHTFVTPSFQSTTPNPNEDHQHRSGSSFLWLIAAYSLFFLTALLILTSLVFALFIIRRRHRHDYYKTFIVKKHQKF